MLVERLVLVLLVLKVVLKRVRDQVLRARHTPSLRLVRDVQTGAILASELAFVAQARRGRGQDRFKGGTASRDQMTRMTRMIRIFPIRQRLQEMDVNLAVFPLQIPRLRPGRLLRG